MKDLTLISASYNTPHVVENMLKTFTYFCPDSPILISENSTNDETAFLLDKNKIPYKRNPGGLHGPSVDLLLDNITTEYALLVDTDVLFLKPHDDIFNQFKKANFCIMGKIEGDRGGKKLHRRINPWHMFINVKQVRAHNIRFYDEFRLKARNVIRYDIGSSFFEDVHQKKLKIGDFDGENTYYKHYEGMSWRVNRYKQTPHDGDIDTCATDTHNNIGLYQFGLQVEQLYKQQTDNLRNLKITYKHK